LLECILKGLKRKAALKCGMSQKRCRLPVTPRILLGLKDFWERRPNDFDSIMNAVVSFVYVLFWLFEVWRGNSAIYEGL